MAQEPHVINTPATATSLFFQTQCDEQNRARAQLVHPALQVATTPAVLTLDERARALKKARRMSLGGANYFDFVFYTSYFPNIFVVFKLLLFSNFIATSESRPVDSTPKPILPTFSFSASGVAVANPSHLVSNYSSSVVNNVSAINDASKNINSVNQNSKRPFSFVSTTPSAPNPATATSKSLYNLFGAYSGRN